MNSFYISLKGYKKENKQKTEEYVTETSLQSQNDVQSGHLQKTFANSGSGCSLRGF